MQSIKIYQIDAFSNQPFGGNPAAVCLLDSWLPTSVMQAIAEENHLSETVFLVGSEGSYEIRWFAPSAEVSLCGHGTLAAAFVVSRFIEPERHALTFRSPKYTLKVKQNDTLFAMDFPRFNYTKLRLDECPEPLRVLGLEAVYEGNETLVLRLNSAAAVQAYVPNLAFLRQENIFLSVTAPGVASDFVSRYFAPSVGIDEDPVTGSVHCLLAPIWGNILTRKNMQAIQLSPRQGKLQLSLGDNYVQIAGEAVCVLKGELYPEGLL